ncbi:hypothetical protein CWATWH0401_3365 [Crocosphaera watsonii WH 0401]|uniref:Methyltransferase FkbM domain-containing protein n=1 Tax=Crocosphaera watsonii WH 0401 TaxID=555881 RepID=T2J9M7_CROWT|nr:hypothetical protein CWATWH0401_3365 [Crocosphaera watsonii WH 0401]
MIKRFLPSKLKNKLKEALGITGLHDRINSLEHTLSTYQKALNQLHSLYNYSVLKEVDLVRYYGSLYFWYTRDISYQWISLSPEPLVIKNYKPTAADFSQDYINTGNLEQDYYALELDKPHLHEQELKHILFLHLWLNEIDFVFIDIGANYGNTAIPAAKFFKKYGQHNPIISFEPGFVYELFKNNVKINQLSDIIQPEKIALGNQNRPIVIKSMLEHSESNSTQELRQFYPDLQLASCHLVDGMTLDNYVEKHQIRSPLLVKIDAEGSDFQVLQGMNKLLNYDVVMLILEYDPKDLKNFMPGEEVLDKLSKDYKLFNMRTLDQNVQWKFSFIGEEMDSFITFSQNVMESPSGWTDILAVRKDLPNLDKLMERILGSAS